MSKAEILVILNRWAQIAPQALPSFTAVVLRTIELLEKGE